jgi:ribosomal protein L40E
VEPSDAERRCHHCGALVGPDAAWCGQCFASVERRHPRAEASLDDAAAGEPVGGEAGAGEATPAEAAADGGSSDAGGSGALTEERRAATWPCPTCGTDNPIDADACATCGTSFGSLLSLTPRREPASARDALAWSFVYPGLGHQRLGLGLDGLARGILFTMTFGMALLIGLGGVSRAPILAVFLLYLLLALAAYGLTAWEAYRVANGAPLFVPSRPLMWVTVGLMLISVVTLALTVATTSRG